MSLFEIVRSDVFTLSITDLHMTQTEYQLCSLPNDTT